jgi:hypothetical protein
MKVNSGSPSGEVKSVNAVKECNVEVAGCGDTKHSWWEKRGKNKYLCLLMPLSGPSIDEVLDHKPSWEQRCLLAKNVVEVMAKLHPNVFING